MTSHDAPENSPRRFKPYPVYKDSGIEWLGEIPAHRNMIGLDVATEALREVLRSRLASVDEILRTAEVCRARTVIRPYLEAMAP
jgi:hypothetical protein